MGNRGRIHEVESQTLLNRRWALKAWILCLTQFNGRQRQIMGNSYTELFFLDEVTGLAAGHRPCFECQRQKANAFQAAFQKGLDLDHKPIVKALDDRLHEERLDKKDKRLHEIASEDLPDGAMISLDRAMMAIKQNALLIWSFDGYQKSGINRRDLPEKVLCLTPPATLAALQAGYQPLWHETAD